MGAKVTVSDATHDEAHGSCIQRTVGCQDEDLGNWNLMPRSSEGLSGPESSNLEGFA